MRAAHRIEQARAQQAFEAVARKEQEEKKAKATESQARQRQMMLLRFTAFLKHPLLKILICLFLVIISHNYVKDTRNVGQHARDALTLAQTRLNSQALAGAKAALTTIPQEYTGDKTWIQKLKNLNQAIETAVAVAKQKERHLAAGRYTTEQLYVTHYFDVLYFLVSCVLKPRASNSI